MLKKKVYKYYCEKYNEIPERDNSFATFQRKDCN